MVINVVSSNLLCLCVLIDIFAENRQNPGETISTLFLNRVSPEVIFLRPPEKLTIEMKASGRYLRLDWTRRAAYLNMAQDFYNHYEIYFQEQTTMDDLGLYEVNPFPSPPLFDQQVLPPELDFVVLLPGKVHYHCNTSKLNTFVLCIQLMQTQQPTMCPW